ncbi:MAG: ATP-binding cassette domain-containing protein, partial [Acutalibacteraceae bacterium]
QQQRKIEETEAFIRKNRAGIKSKMARGRQKQLDRMERLETPEQDAPCPRFRFQALPAPSTEQLAVRGLSVGYHYPVLSQLSFSVRGGERLVVTGFNGVGKSTLLKTLVGQLPPLSGSFSFSAQAAVGYYAQELAWPDPARTPLELAAAQYPSLSEKEVRRCLAQCGVSAKHAMQPAGTLSGGEQAKVKLCLLAQRPHSFLILDEPTNHLDVQAKSALGAALAAFPGTVLLVSHEADFYRDWASRVIDISRAARGSR